MMTKEDFKKHVRTVRRNMPEYNNGRQVIVLSECTQKGMNILDRGSAYAGNTLFEVYKRPSYDKIKAYKGARDMYTSDPASKCFSICSFNPKHFTCSWLTDGAMIFLTYKTEYIVLINE